MEPQINKFWAFRALDAGEGGATRELTLEGVIAAESWFGDEVTPAAFKAELRASSGPILVRINSPGGDCVAAAQIYNALRDYAKDCGSVTVRIDALAASAASVIAMAGDVVEMSPVALMMIHNPWTAAIGDREYMRQAMQLLDEVKESIINAYELKSKQTRSRLDSLMSAETWMSSGKAMELGFADRVYDWVDGAATAAAKAGRMQPAAMAWSIRDVEGAALRKADALVRAGDPPKPDAGLATPEAIQLHTARMRALQLAMQD